MASLQYVKSANLQTVTLGSNYTAGSGTMTLTTGEGANLPSSGDFWLTYDNGAGTIRIFKVTARSSDTLTVSAVSGEGNGDGNLVTGDTLRWALTADALDQLRQDICQTGAYFSASAEKAGNLYLPSDGITFLRDTGSTFASWGPIHKVELPVNGDFSDLNSPSVVSTTGGALYIASTSTGGDNIRGRIKSVPTAPYTIEVGFIPAIRLENYRLCGFCLYDGTKLKTYVINCGSTPEVNRSNWNSVTSINSGTGYANFSWGSPIFMKFEDDNTNWIWSVGPSLNNMEVILTEARNSFLTPTHVGMCVNNNVGSGRAGAHFIHWKQS